MPETTFLTEIPEIEQIMSDRRLQQGLRRCARDHRRDDLTISEHVSKARPSSEIS